jgi:hypothetical protein
MTSFDLDLLIHVFFWSRMQHAKRATRAGGRRKPRKKVAPIRSVEEEEKHQAKLLEEKKREADELQAKEAAEAEAREIEYRKEQMKKAAAEKKARVKGKRSKGNTARFVRGGAGMPGLMGMPMGGGAPDLKKLKAQKARRARRLAAGLDPDAESDPEPEEEKSAPTPAPSSGKPPPPSTPPVTAPALKSSDNYVPPPPKRESKTRKVTQTEQKGVSPINLPMQSAEIFYNGVIMRKKNAFLTSFEAKHLVIWKDRIEIYATYSDTTPEDSAMFSQICTLNAPCARSGRRTEISVCSASSLSVFFLYLSMIYDDVSVCVRVRCLLCSSMSICLLRTDR